MAVAVQAAQVIVKPVRRARDWKTYNEYLMQRGEIDFYLQALDHWDEDLKSINAGKVGLPFAFPDTLFFVAWVLRFLFMIPYRSMEGLLRSLGRMMSFDAPCYTSILLTLTLHHN